VAKSDDTYTDSAMDEIKLLKVVKTADISDPKRNRIVHFFEDFMIQGVHGNHVCMVRNLTLVLF
jgi:hypothetical protein